ncbi:hypothetical protein DFP72DRAFT_1109489 [Ephemerocybe angulata]|uniref:Uncharacterized protein n=1 Tax=Ephemerocybe angulata TaxID=980116 RepID=A0A8H6I607_9AGAR|nr:hypothetical protein DFP72DRAFT_1109489 [Tulosesus angulatus]
MTILNLGLATVFNASNGKENAGNVAVSIVCNDMASLRRRMCQMRLWGILRIWQVLSAPESDSAWYLMALPSTWFEWKWMVLPSQGKRRGSMKMVGEWKVSIYKISDDYGSTWDFQTPNGQFSGPMANNNRPGPGVISHVISHHSHIIALVDREYEKKLSTLSAMFHNQTHLRSTTAPSAPPRKKGRPKGSKDGPRLDTAPPRGRPRKLKAKDAPQNAPQNATGELSDDELDAYFDQEYTNDFFDEVNDIERRVLDASEGSTSPATSGGRQPTDTGEGVARRTYNAHIDSTNTAKSRTRAQLDSAAKATQKQPFFTSKGTLFDGSDDSDSEMEDEDEAEQPVGSARAMGEDNANPWFRKPARMPAWLYTYFGSVIKPMLKLKDGQYCARLLSFTETQSHSPATMWINPPDPAFPLARRQFDPTVLWRPRVFLWLPHLWEVDHCFAWQIPWPFIWFFSLNFAFTFLDFPRSRHSTQDLELREGERPDTQRTETRNNGMAKQSYTFTTYFNLHD